MHGTEPLMLGLVGASAAGKATLVRGVVRLLGQHGVTPLCLDDYHRYARADDKQILRLHGGEPDEHRVRQMNRQQHRPQPEF